MSRCPQYPLDPEIVSVTDTRSGLRSPSALWGWAVRGTVHALAGSDLWEACACVNTPLPGRRGPADRQPHRRHRRQRGRTSPSESRSAVRAGPDGSPSPVLAFHDQVRRIAKGLIAAGVEPGDRVALLSRTRYEWTLVDYALWYVGAVTVPDLRDVLGGAGRVAPHRLRRDGDLRRVGRASRPARPAAQPPPPCLRHVWTLDDGALDDLEDAGTRHLRPGARPSPRGCHADVGGHGDLHLWDDRSPQRTALLRTETSCSRWTRR